MDRHDTIGHDLVGMVVDDLVVCGAEPLFMTDYIACGKVVPERIAAIVKGIAEGCVLAGCALVGGETAEHPGLLGPDEYDVAGAGTGVVEADAAARRRTGSAMVTCWWRWRAAACTPTATRWCATCCSPRPAGRWTGDVPELGRTLGDELLEPTRIYALRLPGADRRRSRCTRSATSPAAGSRPTWPGCCPTHLSATVDRATWSPAPIFGLVRELGGMARHEVERTLNMGVGMVAVVAAADADRAVGLLTGRGVPAWVLGTVTAGDGTVAVDGSHPA